MRQLLKGIVMLSCVLFFPRCEATGLAKEKPEEMGRTLSVMTWNAQALFNGTETGGEYKEYLSSSGWNEEKYRGRLNAIARAIEKIDGGVPGIIALEELENAEILSDLAEKLEKHGYRWNYFAGLPGSSLGVGVLSRFEIGGAKAHSGLDKTDQIPRPVLEIRVKPYGSPLAVFVCHWKSKRGGDAATEGARRLAARVVLRRARELLAEEPSVPIAVVGDLNENHDEFYRRGGETLSALLPDDPDAARISGFLPPGNPQAASGAPPAEKLQRDFLVLSRNKPPAAEHFPEDVISFYSPRQTELQNGSYFYRDNWETIDHLLLSSSFFDESGWEFSSCRVIDEEPFSSGGYPSAYNPRTGAGLSDHLPLLLVLKQAGTEL